VRNLKTKETKEIPALSAPTLFMQKRPQETFSELKGVLDIIARVSSPRICDHEFCCPSIDCLGTTDKRLMAGNKLTL